MEIIEAKFSDLPEIEQLARKVWEPTYRHIVPQAQIDLMEEKMHRVQAYLQQINDQHTFYVAKIQDQIVGFMSVYEKNQILKIPKLYVDTDVHQNGIGKALLQFSKKLSMDKYLKFIELNVNRYNKALIFYRKQDFYISRSEDVPFEKFWMYDYVMRWDVPQQKM